MVSTRPGKFVVTGTPFSALMGNAVTGGANPIPGWALVHSVILAKMKKAVCKTKIWCCTLLMNQLVLYTAA